MNIGNKPDQNDVVYTTPVGVNEPGSVKISDNIMHIKKSNEDLQVKFYPTTINTSKSGEIDKKSFFNIEPGRCFYINLEAKNNYNRKKTLSSNQMCSMSKLYL